MSFDPPEAWGAPGLALEPAPDAPPPLLGPDTGEPPLQDARRTPHVVAIQLALPRRRFARIATLLADPPRQFQVASLANFSLQVKYANARGQTRPLVTAQEPRLYETPRQREVLRWVAIAPKNGSNSGWPISVDLAGLRAFTDCADRSD